ncbi:MAG: hypothetical protein KC620_21850 [Myxococcales bacterium]|nr:hypothetical protein [Myxococcales bacterium]
MTVLSVLVVVSPAFAGRDTDIEVSLSNPGAVQYYDQAHYDVTVSNPSRRDASNVTVRIDLPETHTSPTVHVMGILGATSASCALSGTHLDCALGTVSRGQSKSVFFEIAFPVSDDPADIVVTAATTTSESDLSNNAASATATLLAYSTAVSPTVNAHVRHCTGTNLLGFYECTLYPSSISSHDIVLEPAGALSFVNAPPGYAGTWSQPTGDALLMQYYDNGTLVASFEGLGAGGGCFEGLTHFPGSAYVAPYEVCLQ